MVQRKINLFWFYAFLFSGGKNGILYEIAA